MRKLIASLQKLPQNLKKVKSIESVPADAPAPALQITSLASRLPLEDWPLLLMLKKTTLIMQFLKTNELKANPYKL